MKKNTNLKPLAGFIEYTKGLRARGNDQFNKGIKLLTKAMEYGDKPWFYLERGLCYYFLKEYDKAFSDFNRSVELYPEYTKALFWRSVGYQKKEMYAEALGDLDLAARLDPYNLKVIKNRAYILLKFNQFDEAVDDFKKAVLLNNKKPGVWASLGWYSAFKLNDYQTAANAYKQAIKLDSNNTHYLYNYAVVLSTMRDCTMTPVLKKLLQACKVQRSKQCSDKNINWAKQTMAYLVNSNACAK